MSKDIQFFKNPISKQQAIELIEAFGQGGGGNPNNKGYYQTLGELEAAYPVGEAGWYATVAATGTVWFWSADTDSWEDSGMSPEVGGTNGNLQYNNNGVIAGVKINYEEKAGGNTLSLQAEAAVDANSDGRTIIVTAGESGADAGNGGSVIFSGGGATSPTGNGGNVKIKGGLGDSNGKAYLTTPDESKGIYISENGVILFGNGHEAEINVDTLDADIVLELPRGSGNLATESSAQIAAESAASDATGFKNFGINGDFSVSQLKNNDLYTFSAAGTGVMEWGPDMWFGATVGASMTGQRVAGVNTTYNFRLYGDAGVTVSIFGIRIPSERMIHAKGKKLTVSIFTGSSAVTSLDCQASYCNTKDVFGTISVPNSTPFLFSSVAVDNSFKQKVISLGTVPDQVTNGLEVYFAFTGLGLGETIDFGKFQINIGNTATEFEKLSYAQQLANCAPFFGQSWGSGDWNPNGQAFANDPVGSSPLNVIGSQSFGAEMYGNRTPVVTLFDQAGTPGCVSEPGYSNGLAAVAINVGTTGFNQVRSSGGIFTATVIGYSSWDNRLY